jgi:hypothetical protein
MYFGIFFTSICDEENVLHNLVSGFTSKGFCITNLELFFMVMTKRDLYRSKAVAENNPRTHNSCSPNFFGWQRASLKTTK